MCVTYLLLIFISGVLSQPTAYINQGVLSGLYLKTINNRTFAAFMGIPYAKPPIGKYRFKEPVPASPWKGVYNATSFADDCLQYSYVTYNKDRSIYGSEDCLYVNVFTPMTTPTTRRTRLLEVLVFIHGGAFMFSKGSVYGPQYLLDRDIVLVTISYRLGALGFLSTEDDILPGNNGMKDQVLALKWVKQNIPAFGGNPNIVTISGLSAGGASVHYHMLSPLSRGLFTKAISSSGSALCPWTQVENAREKTMKIADYLGCPTDDSFLTVECLQDRPASRIVGAVRLFMPWLYNPSSPFSVVLEPPGPSAFISEHPIDIILQKKAQNVPYLIAINADEGLYPGSEILADPKLIEEIDTKWNEYLPFLLDYNYTAPEGQMDLISNEIREFYLGDSKVNDSKQAFIKMIGDRMFYAEIIRTAKLHAEYYSAPVYSYLFSYKRSRKDNLFELSSIYDGNGHGNDVGYVLRATNMPLEGNATDRSLSKRMIDYWITFMKGVSMPKRWPTVNENSPYFGFLEIQNPDKKYDIIRFESDYGNEQFWDSLNLNENIPDLHTSKEEELSYENLQILESNIRIKAETSADNHTEESHKN